jgi:hypothetical protein
MSLSQQEFNLFQRCTKALESIADRLENIEKSLDILAGEVPIPYEITKSEEIETVE